MSVTLTPLVTMTSLVTMTPLVTMTWLVTMAAIADRNEISCNQTNINHGPFGSRLANAGVCLASARHLAISTKEPPVLFALPASIVCCHVTFSG